MFRTTNDIYNSFGCFINYLTGSDGKESACNAADPGRSPVGRNGNPLWYFLPGEAHGQRSMAGYSSCGLSRHD